MLQGIIIMYMASQHMIHPVLDYSGEDVAKGLQVIHIHIYIFRCLHLCTYVYIHTCTCIYICIYTRSWMLLRASR